MILNNSESNKRQSDEIGVCLKSKDWTVIWQNEQCIDSCGRRCGQICKDNCRALAESSSSVEEVGARVFRQEEILNQKYDIVVCQSPTEILSILCPIASRVSDLNEFYLSKGLSTREREVAELKNNGARNKEICAKLHIAPSTLKTHLSRIKEKLEK